MFKTPSYLSNQSPSCSPNLCAGRWLPYNLYYHTKLTIAYYWSHPWGSAPGWLPGNVGGDGSGVRVQHFLHGVVPLAAMAVDAVFLVRQDVLLVLHKEVRHLLAGGHDHRAGRVVTIILDHAAVTGGIGDVKVVVTAASGKHIVLLQQLHGLGGGGGAVHTSMAEVSRLKS